MIEETNPQTPHPAADADRAAEAPIGSAEPVISELKETAELPVEATVEADETDYEAAFMELRATYAAKERDSEALKTQVEDKQNQYLRLAADFENFRRRTQKEKEDLEQLVKCNTINELLSVVDKHGLEILA